MSPDQLPTPVYDFSEPSVGSGCAEILNDIGVSQWANTKMDQLLHPKNKPGFEESWEAGGTFGGTLYDSRDLKMLRFSTSDIVSLLPNVGLLWPGGSIGYTGSAFIQHNKSSYVSYKASVNALNVNGGGKLVSFPYRFTSSPVEHRTLDNKGRLIKVKHGFHTRVQTMEFEAIRHFRANQITEGKKAIWVPGWTAGFGALHYTPYATHYVRTTTVPYTWSLGKGSDVTANLRRAGTARTNHIEGMSRYVSLALMDRTGFHIS